MSILVLVFIPSLPKPEAGDGKHDQGQTHGGGVEHLEGIIAGAQVIINY